MCAFFPVLRAPCLPITVKLSLMGHNLIDKIHWVFFGDSLLLKELKRLRLETQLQKQAMDYLCLITSSDDVAFGRILTAQLSLYLANGVPASVKNHI